MPPSALRCLAIAKHKTGGRCGLEVEDGELLMCGKHARDARERLRLRERVAYGGHTLWREYRTNSGDLRDDWHYAVAEHSQCPAPVRSILVRHLFDEIDRCNADPFPRCTAPRLVPLPDVEDDRYWSRFRSHEL